MVDFSLISPHLCVRISPKAKRLALRLDVRARKVNLVIPKRASLRKAYEFAEQNKAWITEKINTLPRPIPFADGEVIPILGQPRRITFQQTDSRIGRVTLSDDSILVEMRSDDIAPRLTRFIKALAVEELTKRAHEKAALLDKKIVKLIVRDMKTRWGSCSTAGHMTLSRRLIFAPPEAVDYVVAHEAAHLVHPDHSDRFWALCERLSDDFDGGRDWMKRHGASLSLYGISRDITE